MSLLILFGGPPTIFSTTGQGYTWTYMAGQIFTTTATTPDTPWSIVVLPTENCP